MTDISQEKRIGVYRGLSNDEYHLDPAYGSSTIKAISKSPADLYFNPFKGSRSSHLGSAIHSAILEPDIFKDRYVLLPECDRRSSEYKAASNEFGSDFVLVGSEVESVNGMFKASRLNSDFMDYLSSSGDSELSMFATCPETGLNLKCRFDRLSSTHGYPLDLKSCRDASYRGFSQAFGQYAYHVQAAFYLYVLNLCTGDEPEQFAFFAVQNSAPFKNCMYYIGDESLELGRKIMFESMHKLVQCISDESARVEGVALQSSQIDVPSYLFDEENDDEVII